MRKFLNGQIFFSFALAVVLLILFITDLGYNYQARMVPMLVVVPSLILAVVQLVTEVRRVLQGKESVEEKTRAEEEMALAAIAAAQAKAKMKEEQGAVSALAVGLTATGVGGNVATKPLTAKTTNATPAEISKSGKDGKIGEEKLSPAERQKKEVIAFGWMIGIVLMIALFGFNVGLPISVFAFIKVFGRESWKLSLGYTVSLWLIVYLVFVMFMHSILYSGMVFDALGF